MKEKVKYMEKSKKKNKITKWAAGVYIALLISFSSFVVMDTFVIEKTYGALESAAVQSDVQSSNTGAKVTDTTYEDETKEVTISTYRENGTTIYVADIILKDGESIKTALAQNT